MPFESPGLHYFSQIELLKTDRASTTASSVKARGAYSDVVLGHLALVGSVGPTQARLHITSRMIHVMSHV